MTQPARGRQSSGGTGSSTCSRRRRRRSRVGPVLGCRDRRQRGRAGHRLRPDFHRSLLLGQELRRRDRRRHQAAEEPPHRRGGIPADVQIAPGGSHNCARLPSAAVLCWGKGGRLGNGTSQASLTPVSVAGGVVFAAIWSDGTTPAAVRTTSRAGPIAGATTGEASWATAPRRSGWLPPSCCSRNHRQA